MPKTSLHWHLHNYPVVRLRWRQKHCVLKRRPETFFRQIRRRIFHLIDCAFFGYLHENTNKGQEKLGMVFTQAERDW